MEKVNRATSSVLKWLKGSTPYLLALILILSGAFELYSLYTSNATSNWGFIDEIAAAVIKIIIAEFILFDPKKNVVRTVGFYAMSIGISRVIMSISTLAMVSTISLAIGLVTLIMGANLLYSSYKYLSDTSRGLLGMILSTSVLALLQVAIILVNYQTKLMTGIPLYENTAPIIIGFFQYLILLLILDTKEIKYSTLLQQINTRVERLRLTNIAENSLMLKRDDGLILKHMFDDRSSWEPLTDGGPVESEKRLILVKDRIKSVMILQKWKDHDIIYVTMANDESGSVMVANRFSVSEVFADGDDTEFTSLKMFDGKRMLMNLKVEPHVPEQEASA